MQQGPAHPNSETIAMNHKPMRVIFPFAFVFDLLSPSGPALAQYQPAASIPAAFEALHILGFTRVKILYIADNFCTD